MGGGVGCGGAAAKGRAKAERATARQTRSLTRSLVGSNNREERWHWRFDASCRRPAKSAGIAPRRRGREAQHDALRCTLLRQCWSPLHGHGGLLFDTLDKVVLRLDTLL